MRFIFPDRQAVPPAPFVGKAILSSLHWCVNFIINQVTVYLWVLHSFPLAYFSILSQYQSRNLISDSESPADLFFSSRPSWLFLVLCILYKFQNYFVSFHKMPAGLEDYTEYIDQLQENKRPAMLMLPIQMSGISLHLFRSC